MSDEAKECFVVGNYKIQNECESSACDQESGVDTYINSGGMVPCPACALPYKP